MIKDTLAQGMPRISISKEDSQTFGLVYIEPAHPNLKFDLQKYVNASLRNIKNTRELTKGKCDVKNIKQKTKKNSNGFSFEEITYELVHPLDSTKILCLLKQCLFFENEFGFVVHTSGPSTNFDSNFMDTISDKIRFKKPGFLE